MSDAVPEAEPGPPDTADAPPQVDAPVTIEEPAPSGEAAMAETAAPADPAPPIEIVISEEPAPTEVTEPTEITEATEVTETTKATEVTETTEVTEPTETTEVTETTKTTEVTETTEVTTAAEETLTVENGQEVDNSEEREEKGGEGMEVRESEQEIEEHPTLTDIREETEPAAEVITKSLENVDLAEEPIITVTSVLNLSEEGDIPEIRPSTPEVADQEASGEIEGAPETDSLTELLEELKLLKEEEEKLSIENSQHQHRLVEHFRSKRADERLGTAGEAERERGVTDYEQRYDKYLSVLQDRQSEARKMREYSDQLLRSACETEREIASELELVVREESGFKQETMLSALDSRTGKQMSRELMERLLRDEAKKEAEVSSIRLENIKLSRNLVKREEQLRQKEEVAEGLHKIEFEQLKIEHQKNNEKIEDRNEDINRLRGKITRTVQVLTHVKEKQHFVASENTSQSEQLAESDVQVALMRDRLTYVKQSRDRLRGDSQRLQDKGGLVNHKKLLRDLEEKQDLAEELESRLVQLKRRHAELGQMSDGIKQKITQTKASGSLSMLQVPH